MSWWYEEPGHQQPLQWPSSQGIFRPQHQLHLSLIIIRSITCKSLLMLIPWLLGSPGACVTIAKILFTSVGNSHRPASPRPTTLEEDRELFVDFPSISCLWFEIQGMRTYNFFDWVSNTAFHWKLLAESLLWLDDVYKHHPITAKLSAKSF